jgi:hypothetical protein
LEPEALPAAVALANNLPPERIFLSAAGESGLGDCALARRWITGFERDDRYSSINENLLLCEPEALSHLRELFREAGVGDVDLEFILGDTMDPAVRGRLSDDGIEAGRPYPPDAFPDWVFLDDDSWVDVKLVLVRRSPAGRPVVFTLDEESDGTRRLVELSRWHNDVTNADLGLVDEIERSLHPLVVRHLVEGMLAGPGGGQLVCTTHDSNLLDRTMLPADSIWFAQKGADGASKLYSLAEFDPAQLAALENDLENGYLNGRFGAIPFLGDARRLGWSR